jgi:hypothetical protein
MVRSRCRLVALLDVACHPAAAPPGAPPPAPPPAPPAVIVGPEAIAVDHAPVVPLVSGRVDAALLAGPAIPHLVSALQARPRARPADVCLVTVDPDGSFLLLMQVLHSLSAAQLPKIVLMMRDDTLAPGVPDTMVVRLAPQEPATQHAGVLILISDMVVVRLVSDGARAKARASLRLDDHQGLRQALLDLVAQAPALDTVTVMATRGLKMEDLLPILHAMRRSSDRRPLFSSVELDGPLWERP